MIVNHKTYLKNVKRPNPGTIITQFDSPDSIICYFGLKIEWPIKCRKEHIIMCDRNVHLILFCLDTHTARGNIFWSTFSFPLINRTK